MQNTWNQAIKINEQIADWQVSVFVTAWFWPYYIMGNLDSWQKLGIIMNGIKPICDASH